MKQFLKKIKKTQGYLITDPANIQYLTNFTGSNGAVLLTQKKAYLITDARYTRVAQKVAPDNVDVIITSYLYQDLKSLLKINKIRTVLFEAHRVSVQQHQMMKLLLPRTKPTTGFVEKFRMVKTDEEIKHLIKSQRLNEKTLKEVIKKLKTGKTEKQIAWEIQTIGRDLGADDISFEPIVGFGTNSGSPHHHNTTRKLKKGDMVLIDMGMKYKGYCSDMTRTFFTQKPTAKQAEIYNLVLKAQVEAEKALRPNMWGKTADGVARDIIAKAGYGPQFSHSLGHGIGLEVHEAPSLSTGYRKRLPEGTVVTIEPGIYLENSFGVRIEDMVILRRNKAENITKIPKKLEESILSIS